MPERLDPPDPATAHSVRPDWDDPDESESENNTGNFSQVLWRVFNMRFLRGVLTAVVALALVLYFGVAATALVLRVVVMPRIDNFRPRIEAAASDALGAKVSIVALSAHWQGLSPAIEIFGLTVRNRDGVVALSVPHASAVVAWRSLLRFKPLLVSLLVEHPEVLAARHSDGSFEVAGVAIKTNGGNKNQLAHWLFTQSTIVLRGGTLQWRDDTRAVPELAIHNIKLAIFNFGHSHRVGVQADGDGRLLRGPLDFRAEFRHGVLADPGVPEGWLGRVYLSAHALDLPTLGSYLDLPVEATEGQVSANLTLAFARMKISSVEGDLAGDSLALRANPQLPVIDAPSINMHFRIRHTDNTYQLALRQLSMTLADELPLADGTPLDRLLTINQMDATYQAPMLGHGQSLSISGDLADVGLLASFSRKLPLPRTLAEQLIRFDPRGVIRDYTVAWERAAPTDAAALGSSEVNNAPIVHYRLKAALDNLSIAAQAPPPGQTAQGHEHIGLPGFDNLSGLLDTTERHGALTLASKQASITINGLFDQPQIDFDRIDGHLIWDLGQDGTRHTVEVRSPDLTLVNSDASVTTQADYRNDGTSRGALDLTAHFARMNLPAVARYMPSSIDVNLRDYLGHAIRAGTTNDATIAIQGQLENFPFDRESRPGTFRITAGFHDGSFDPSPVPAILMSNGRAQQWPMLDQISGTFDLNREQLGFTVDHANYRKLVLANVRGHIANLPSPDNDLIIDGSTAGPLNDLLAYMVASPVNVWTGHVLDKLDGSGPTTLALTLSLPRAKGGQAHVTGSVGLHNDTLAYLGGPPVSEMNGQLQFTDRSLTLRHITGQFLGDAVSAEGGIASDGSLAATVSGRVNATAMRNPAAEGRFDSLSGLLSGTASYTLNLHASQPGVPDVTGSADLTDLAINLPAPVGKTTGTPMPLHFEIRALDGAAASAHAPPELAAHALPELAAHGRPAAEATRHDKASEITSSEPLTQIEASFGVVSLNYLLRAPADAEPSPATTTAVRPLSPEIVRGAIGVNHPAVLPQQGVSANLTLAELDADAWRDALARLPQPVAAADGAYRDALPAFLPTQVKAHVGTLELLSRTWTNLDLDGSHNNDLWQGEVSSDQLTGHLAWRAQSPLSPAGEMSARLAKLTIPAAHAGDPFLQELRSQPRHLPALDLVIDDFTASARNFGKFELQARNLEHDGLPVWQIDQLKVSNPAAKLSATGTWRIASENPGAPGTPRPVDASTESTVVSDDPRRTELDFKMDINDAGALLSRLGLPRTLQQGNGTLAGHIGWHGAPDTIDIPTLTGNLALDIHHGQILKVDPGIGKLLGVLSLQSLVRFITFDFRGVTGAGLAFDSVTASSKIALGVARTDDFKLDSSAAHVSMKGTADIAHETQDLRVMVVPTLSASSAALAATVINPLLGLGSFVAQLVLSDSLSRALAVDYSVTGPWAAPEIRQIKGRQPFVNPADTVPQTEPAA